jgi:PilZ domain-containing protein
MLRYVFDDPLQARRHLHSAEGHSLLFFGNPRAPGIGGERVVLDLEVPSRGQYSLLRGTVHSRLAGAGMWLDFPDVSLLRRLEEPGPELRKQRRFAADLMMELHILGSEAKQVGKLVDVSLGGARISGCRIPVGSEVTARLALPMHDLPRDFGRARVLRVGERDSAIEFVRDEDRARMAVAKLIEAMHTSWERAPMVAHPPACCGPNGVLEPPLPRLRPRD